MSYLRYLSLLAYSGFQRILRCGFVLFVFVLCNICCQFLWIVHLFHCLFDILSCLFTVGQIYRTIITSFDVLHCNNGFLKGFPRIFRQS